MRYMHWTGLAAAAILSITACGTPAPAPRLYQLRTEAPVATPPAAQPAQSQRPQKPVWELAADVSVPAYLDRETLVVLGGNARLQLLDGQRWAEPLRDTLPRLLRHDLALLRGASSIWPAPAPPGVVVARQLRVEVLALHASSESGAVVLQARWWFSDRDRTAPSSARSPTQVLTAELTVPVASMTDGDAIASAHRKVLWQLAETIARQQP